MSGPPVLDLQMTSDYELMWGHNGTELGPGAAFYRPRAASGHFILGDHCQSNSNGPDGATLVVADDGGDGYLAPPTGFSSLLPAYQATVWAPLAPSGYVALGCVATASGVEPESIANLRCVRRDLVRPVAPGPWITWTDFQRPATFYSVPGTGLFQGQTGFPMDAAGIPLEDVGVSEKQQELQRLPPSVEIWLPNNL